VTRRQLLKQIAAAALLAPVPEERLARFTEPPDQETSAVRPLNKTKSEWRKLLTPEQYDVLFDGETERAFSSPLNNEKREGTYVCAACYLPLFSSKTKFDSGTGWPSFSEPISGRVRTKRDFKLILPRTEYHCVRCGGHQGHLFDDGPPPTRQRWCNNGVALKFIPDGEPQPQLRN
jgi:peptide-methionine (R)-S-oxide reductase